MAVANFLVALSFALVSLHIGLVTTFLYTSNKKSIILFSAVIFLYMNGKVLHQGQRLENGLPVYFRLNRQHSLQKVQSQHDSAQATMHKG